MELKQGYKQTETGIIPAAWRVSTVGQEFEIQLGKMLDAEKNKGDFKPYLGNRAVQWGRIDAENLPRMAMSRSDMERFRLCSGDLLVCEGGEAGRAAIWEAPVDECYYQKALHRLRPLRGFSPQLMLSFLHFWIDHGALSEVISQTSIAHLTRERLAEVPVPLPDPHEQRAIAAALSDVDALLAKLDALIAKKRDIKQAAMQQLLTGKRRLPGFGGGTPRYGRTDAGVIPEDWETNQIGALATVKTGPFGSALHERDYVQDGTPIITVEHLTDYGISHSELPMVSEIDRHRLETYSLDLHDIVFSRVGSIDRSAMVHNAEIGWLFSGRLLRVRPNARVIDSCYLSYHFQSQPFRLRVRSLAVGQTMPSLNTKILSGVEVVVPSLPEQRAIAAILSDMDAEIAALEARREKTRALKQGMMQELLTGRIRLV